MSAEKAVAVEACGLARVFGEEATRVEALSGIDLRINRGEFVAIMGPSGSGKSTLLHLLGGLDEPTSGSVMVDGQDLSSMSDDEITQLRRRHIGFVFQAFNLLHVLTAGENVALPLIVDGRSEAEANEQARAVLERVGIANRKDHYPTELAGGEQQRVALARSLCADPVLLLADEPTGNLDSRNSEQIIALLRKLVDEHGHPTRTSLVVGVLMISVMLSTGFGNAILNSVRDSREWMVRIFANQDFLVVPTALSGTELLPVAMPEEYADRISELEGVRRVGKGSILSTRAAGHRITIFPRSCRPGEDPGFRIVGGADAEAREGLRRGEVVIGTVLSQRTGLQRGDQISIETRHGARPFTIAGLTADYTAGGMITLIEWDHAKQFFNMEGVRYIYVVAQPDDRAGVEKRLRAFCDERDLLIHSRAGFTSTCDEMMAGVINSAWVLLALVFVVASLGITNCLTMNVLEQTRELGILRAIAMKRRQVCKMILAQALAIGVISTFPGVVLGVLLGYAVTSANHAIVGLRIPYMLEPTLLLGCVGMALVVAVLASLPPARRAGRLTIIRALQYE